MTRDLPWERPTREKHVQTPEGPDDYCTGCGELWPCSFEQGWAARSSPAPAGLRDALQAVWDLGDELDSNHARWAALTVAERLGIQLDAHNRFSEPPRNRNEEDMAALQAEIDRLNDGLVALREWVLKEGHPYRCILNRQLTEQEGWDVEAGRLDLKKCDCGLDAALAARLAPPIDRDAGEGTA